MRRRDAFVSASSLLAVWLALGGAIGVYVHASASHLWRASSAEAPRARSAGLPYVRAYAPGAGDGFIWMRLAEDVTRTGNLRPHFTGFDNTPDGRPVHWNSAWPATIAAIAAGDRILTGATVTQSLERTSLWLLPTILFSVIVVVSATLAIRAGLFVGAAAALAMWGHEYFAGGFSPSYLDHHGLASAAVLVMTLGWAFMLGGWHTARSLHDTGDAVVVSRRAALVSALAGALGLWISAASVVPVIAVLGIAGLVARRGDTAPPPERVAAAWRTWGRVGALASVGFYLLEYFPTGVALRLEVNHPLYALAWWAGAEFIAHVVLAGDNPSRARPLLTTARLIGLTTLIVLPAILIVALGDAVFLPADPFLASLHREHISEFFPLWDLIGQSSWNPWFSVVGIENVVLVVALAWIGYRWRDSSYALRALSLATLGCTALAWWQVRWLTPLSALQIALALALAQELSGRIRSARLRAVAVLGVAAVLFLPTAVDRPVQMRRLAATPETDPALQVQMLYRDIAAAIRASSPVASVRLASTPNVSLYTAFFGGFATLGTLYWENRDGLRAAAELLTAPSADSALSFIRQRQITHLAFVSSDPFLAPYFSLLHPHEPPDSYTRSFAHQVEVLGRVPRWLRAIPYSPPPAARALSVSVQLYEVALDQNETEALAAVAKARLASGDVERAEAHFDTLLLRTDAPHDAWLGRATARFARGRWEAGVADARVGIARAPVAARDTLVHFVAGRLVAANQHRYATVIYRDALERTFDAEVAASLAWILATAQDSTVRNGREALELARRAIQPDSTAAALLVLAAAEAETGDFDAALATAARAALRARNSGDTEAFQSAARLAVAFRQRQPWRH